MINLMPEDTKKEIRAARVNVLLNRYIILILSAGVFLAIVIGGSYYILNQTRANAELLIKTNDTKADVYSSTKAQVAELSSSLSETKGILDQEVSYSNVLTRIANLMPAGTIIDTIELDSSSFGSTPLNLKVYAKTTNEAIALRDKFQSSPYFTNVNFETISDNNAGVTGYPVGATMTLTLNRTIAQ